MSDLIRREDIPYHKQLEPMGNGQYAEVEVVYKDDIEALPSVEPCDKDSVSRAGLLKSWEELSPRGRTEFDQVIMTIPALPSAEARPTVIRSKTLMPTKDFNEWAKRVRETNPDAVVIPCDAEVVSADEVIDTALSDIEKWRTWSHTYDNMCRGEEE